MEDDETTDVPPEFIAVVGNIYDALANGSHMGNTIRQVVDSAKIDNLGSITTGDEETVLVYQLIKIYKLEGMLVAKEVRE